MVILGFLSLLQMAVIPGWITTSFWRHPSWLSRWLLTFALSLLINYWLVVILVVLHIFNQPVVWGIVIVELITIVIINWQKWRLGQLQKDFNLAIPLMSKKDFPGSAWWRAVLTMAVLLAFISAVISIFAQVSSHNPGVFDLWDDFVSFNRWALIWYQGNMPTDNQFYPQLIPANWALGYQLMGRGDIQFFAKALMGIFPLAILGVFADLWHRYRHLAWLLGGIITAIWLTAVANNFLGSGYVDIPLAFVAILAYSIVLSIPTSLTASWWPLILTSVLVSTGALVKQGGLFIFIVFLIGIIILFWKQSWRKMLLSLGVSLVVFSIVALPWYGYRWYQIKLGVSTSEVASVKSALERSVGKSASSSDKVFLATRSVSTAITIESLRSLHLLPKNFDQTSAIFSVSFTRSLIVFVFLVWLGLLIFGLFHPISRLILLLIVLPYYLIWANLYSYDFRNLILILPFIGIVSGFGLFQLIKLVFRSSGVKTVETDTSDTKYLLEPWNWFRGGVYVLIGIWVIGILVAVLCQWQYPTEKLQEIHSQKMSQVGSSGLNKQLYSYYRANGFSGKIRTMYLPMAYLPELKDYALVSPDTLTLDLLHKYEQNPNVHYIFWWTESVSPDVLTYIENQIKNKKYSPIFWKLDYQFFKIK